MVVAVVVAVLVAAVVTVEAVVVVTTIFVRPALFPILTCPSMPVFVSNPVPSVTDDLSVFAIAVCFAWLSMLLLGSSNPVLSAAADLPAPVVVVSLAWLSIFLLRSNGGSLARTNGDVFLGCNFGRALISGLIL